MDTGTSVQQEDQSYTEGVESTTREGRGYRFSEPDVRYPKEKQVFIEDGVEVEEDFEMTKSQWGRYYKKIGLE